LGVVVKNRLVERYKPKPTGQRVVQDRIYEALKEAAKSNKTISGAELYEIAYPDGEPADWGTFQQHVSRLNKRLQKEGHGVVAQSTVHYRLQNLEDVRDYRRVPKRFNEG
jgi:hypothetical protein